MQTSTLFVVIAGLSLLAYYTGLTRAQQHQNGAKLLALPDQWRIPVFPVTGKDLIAVGIPPGKELGEHLRRLEQWWMDAGFPEDKSAILAQLE